MFKNLLEQILATTLLLGAIIASASVCNAATIGIDSEYVFTSGASGDGGNTFLTGDTALVEWDRVFEVEIPDFDILGITVDFFGIPGATNIIGNDSGSGCDKNADDAVWSACYTIISGDGPLIGEIATVNALLFDGTSSFVIAFRDIEIFDVNPPAAIPLPAAIWLFGSALIGLVGFSNRRKRPEPK